MVNLKTWNNLEVSEYHGYPVNFGLQVVSSNMAGKGDKWAEEIGQTYLSVLTRPAYGVIIIEKFILSPPAFPGGTQLVYRAVIEKDENRYQFTVNFDKQKVSVHVLPMNEEGVVDWAGHCQYKKTFRRNRPEKVRKSALILAKKMGMRAVMDIMKQ
jgi:hypothetical protein